MATMAIASVAEATLPAIERPTRSWNLPLGYLRAFCTLLVVAHHAALAYYPTRPPVPVSLLHQPRWWQAFPVVDVVQSKVFLFTVLFNDVFFMSLMFLLSGLFTWQSLQHRGIAEFVRGRFLRLGVPFLVFALLAPAGYYPAYLQSATHDGFWREWLSLGNWPGGPVWFLWVLLCFDLIAAMMFAFIPKLFLDCARRLGSLQNPLHVAAILLLLSAAAYVPLALHFNRYEFWFWGFFYVQKCRVLLYALYFFFGVALGAGGLENGILRERGRLASQWAGWLAASPIAFGLMLALNYESHRHWAPTPWAIAIDLAFVLSCLVSSFACLGCFLHFVRKEHAVLTHLLGCAYTIYLVHYFFVAWLHYALLSVPLPALVKGAVVLVTAVLLSWAASATLRKVPAFARVL